MKSEIEKREAGDKVKGFRLQKLRAVKLALQELENNQDSHIYFSIELFSDVFLYSDDYEKVTEKAEEDKNYDPNKSFTFNSEQIRNTLVIFLAVWKEKQLSKNLHFSFYTSAKIGKEKGVGWLKGKKIPKNGILRNLSEKKYYEENTLDLAIDLLLKEIDNQGNSDLKEFYEGYDIKDWESFFNIIVWDFNQIDEVALESEVCELIKKSILFKRQYHRGMERFIMKYILDELDSKQSRTDFFERIISATDIKLVFALAERGELKGCDPSYQVFEDIVINDKRNMNEKLVSIWPDYSLHKQEIIARKITIGKAEQNDLKGEKSLSAQLCRIYDKCEDLLSNLTSQTISEFTVEEILKKLLVSSVQHLEELSKTYKYPLMNKESIRCLIYDLFDRCYLNFDIINDKVEK